MNAVCVCARAAPHKDNIRIGSGVRALREAKYQSFDIIETKVGFGGAVGSNLRPTDYEF
jgi:hypothetical protein